MSGLFRCHRCRFTTDDGMAIHRLWINEYYMFGLCCTTCWGGMCFAERLEFYAQWYRTHLPFPHDIPWQVVSAAIWAEAAQ